MRVLVCGGRNYDCLASVCGLLDGLNSKQNISVIIEGGATGADGLARQWAGFHKKEVLSFPADWKAHSRMAGPIRNQKMIDDGKPDFVVAFPGGRGTADMIRRARKAGLMVIEAAA